eukprot:scaffold242517_cov32-Tisochrysis_lutea.AAC.2
MRQGDGVQIPGGVQAAGSAQARAPSHTSCLRLISRLSSAPIGLVIECAPITCMALAKGRESQGPS